MKPLLLLIGADKGGVGKTTVSRVLTDYLEAGKYDFRAFDTEYPKGVLKRFVPGKTEVVDLTNVQEQMRVFDTLTHNPVTIIDVRAGLLSPTLKTLGDIGLLELVRTQQVTLMVMHVLGPSMASLEEVEATAKIIEGSIHFLIQNHINDTEFFKWDPATYEKVFGEAENRIIDVPRLIEMATEHVETNGVTYTQFVNNQNADGTPAKYSFVLRGLVRTWMKAVFAEFDRVNINGTVGAAITS
jgi:hypothetical protein